MNFLRKPGVLAAVGAAVVVVVLGLWAIFTNIGVTNDGNKREADLNVRYLNAQNYLSDCITKIRETANVTQAQAAKFEEVMVETIKGRYDGKLSSASPSIGGGQLFSAVVENYPDLSGLNQAFERVYTVIVGCRTDYRGKQSELLDVLRSYDQWRTGSFTVRFFGDGEFPSNNLEARVGTSVVRGAEARDRMYTIVLVKDAQNAYNTGEITPENPFGVPSPSAK